MDDVDVFATGDGPSDDEVLDTGRPPSRAQRIAAWAVAALAIAGLIGYLAVHTGGRHDAAPLPGPTTAPAPSLTPVTVQIDSGMGSAPPVIVGDRMYWFLDGNVHSYDLVTGAARSAALPATAGDGDDFELFVDARRHLIWLVSLNIPQVSVTEIDSRTLTSLTRVEVLGRATDADLLDGELFVATGRSLLQMPTAAVGQFSVETQAQAVAVAADPSRHRILVLSNGGGSRFQARAGGRSVASAPAGFGKGDLLVVDGQIWAGGYGTHDVLVRLDPQTLRPVQHSRLEAQLRPGAELIAGGRHDFLVRSGAGGNALWCVDAHSGAVVHTWANLPGPVTLSPRGVYQLVGNAPRRVNSGACVG